MDSTTEFIRPSLEFNYDAPSVMLAHAAEIMERSYWLKGSSASAYSSERDVRRYDILGALISSGGFELHEAYIVPGESVAYNYRYGNQQKRRSNVEKWQRTLSRRGRQCYVRCLVYLVDVVGYGDLEQWNDQIAQDKEEVVEALRDAAALARKKDD